VRAKKPRKLTVALTQEEAKAVLKGLSGISWLMASLFYSSRLRLMECIRSRVKGMDVAFHYIVVGDGQGGKERVTVLPLNIKLPCSAMCML
jgi:site-specific recombinase XerD